MERVRKCLVFVARFQAREKPEVQAITGTSFIKAELFGCRIRPTQSFKNACRERVINSPSLQSRQSQQDKASLIIPERRRRLDAGLARRELIVANVIVVPRGALSASRDFTRTNHVVCFVLGLSRNEVAPSRRTKSRQIRCLISRLICL
ncbi:hypothetical protein MRX96_029289 [Rhipicephalus microplus]